MSTDKSLTPFDTDELSASLREASANGACAILSNSAATYDSRKPHKFLDLSKFTRILEHRPEDQVISVETGIELEKLDQLLAKHNQWLPLSAAKGTRLIEAIDRGDGGCLEHGFGGPRDLVLGMDVALSSGVVIKTGGKVVKNVTGYDLSKIFVGSRGTLGIIASANLRLFARPESWRILMVQNDSPATLVEIAQRIIASGLPVSCLELIDQMWVCNHSDQRKTATETGFPESEIFQFEKRFALIVAVSGHDDVVQEIGEQIVVALGGSKHTTIETPAHEVLHILDSIALMRSTETDVTWLESMLTLSDLSYGLQTWWKAAGNPPIYARPGTGRLRLQIARENADRVIESIAEAAKGRRIAIAIADQECQYRVVHKPPQEDTVQRIRDELKLKFDALNMLNPHLKL